MVIPGPVKKIGRGVFIAAVVLAFLWTGWPVGVVLCLASGLAGLLGPFVVASRMNRSTPAASQVTVQRLTPVLPPLGRSAILRDMAQNGISRTKVRRLIYHGRLLAFEDPKDGKVSLVRPEDMEAMGLDPNDRENEGPK